MSRLIVKNLPNKIKEQRIQEIFSSQGGEITDVKLCYTKAGVFRKFGFIGFREAEMAEQAKNYLDKTFIDTSKISVSICKALGDQSVPRPWSKYNEQSSAFSRKAKEIQERKDRILQLQNKKVEKTEKEPATKQPKELAPEDDKLSGLKEVQADPDFQEFLQLHENKSVKQSWTNEADGKKTKKKEERRKEEKKKSKLNDIDEQIKKLEMELEQEEGDSGNSSDDDSEDEDEKEEASDKSEEEDSEEEGDVEEEAEQLQIQKPAPTGKSDLDWLRSKVTKTEGETTSNVKIDEDEDRHENAVEDAVEAKEEEIEEEKEDEEENEDKEEEKLETSTLKMRGIPFKCTEQDIITFFKKRSITDIRFPTNKDGKRSGYAFVDFESQKELEKAMKRHGKKLGKRYIELFPVENKKKAPKEDRPAWEVKASNEPDEPVSDTGRIFVRNLSYSCQESDLETLFTIFGPLTEINMPVSKSTNKTVGYAFVTFMLPEHAVAAMNKLDGSVFQGRMIHLLPSKAKKEAATKQDQEGGTSSYKKAKEAEKKALSTSAHNWNALFLGANTVAEVMAQKIKADKSQILSDETEGKKDSSLAVRMALGETEIVSETRKFLEENGVKLDKFGQASSARSKEVILVKNLPSGTTAAELSEVFTPHGNIGRLVMPPFGVTAIIEFISASEAKKAFQNLAYSKFKHTPLFLEWAPIDCMQAASVNAGKDVKDADTKKQATNESDSEVEEEEDQEEQGTVIFVKNLNFNTTEESMKEKFCSCGKISTVTIAKKKDPKKSDQMLSMGYGFVTFKKTKSADKCLKLLQHTELDGHKLELKRSNREVTAVKSSRKRAHETKQTSSKILVRNIPFEADYKEIKQLFSNFGEIKSLRLPKKMSGTGTHRGFAFVDFLSKQEAKRAFKALCQSTHLYGRRLVLEWADADESVDMIRLKTSQQFSGASEAKKQRKSEILESLERSAAGDS